jgi:hypothetical protein
MDLKVRVLQGAKVKVQPHRLADFQGPTLDVQDAVDKLTSEHTREYEDMLSACLEPTRESEVAPSVDARALDEPISTETIELAKHDSEEALKAAVKVTHSVKSAEKGITFFKDETDNFYMMAVKDTVVQEGTQVGGVGGGAILRQDDDAKKVWPWDMPRNDKTFVQMQRAASEEGDQASKKITSGTLYSIARDIEASGAKPPKLTCFGELRPVGTAGRHQYEFEFPRDSDQHERMAFVPSAGSAHANLHTNIATIPRVLIAAAHVHQTQVVLRTGPRRQTSSQTPCIKTRPVWAMAR